MSSFNKVAFCITCKGRLQHIKQTLLKNLADNKDSNAVFILLNYNSNDGLTEYVLENHAAELESGQLVLYTYTPPDKFHMAHAKNMAHRLGIIEGADILVNLDADNYTGPRFADYIIEKFNTYSHIFLWAKMIQRCNAPCEDGGCCVLPREHTEEHTSILTDLVTEYSPNERPLSRGISGRIVLSTQAFLNVGGYDEKYSTWGPDDKNMNIRLNKLGYHPYQIEHQHLGAIHHGPGLRFKDYPHLKCVEQISGDLPIVIDPHSAVVNFGNIGCGVVTKFGGETINIQPIPTRIFGIGMQKTCTTSLNGALNILGFDAAHWESPRRARDIWQEMREFGKSLTMEAFYAASDLPISLMYEQFDKSYPGSKFILTIRNGDHWLESVRNHWSYEHNPWRADWDWDCFSHRIHKELYGKKQFDAPVFLERYHQHNEEVLRYFANRRDDLLVIDIERSPTWDALCKFLDKPIPAVPFPHKNKTV
jgi:hypothetical protein